MPTYVSVFAGRIADTGVDPLPLMKEAVNAYAYGGKYGVKFDYGQVAANYSM